MRRQRGRRGAPLLACSYLIGLSENIRYLELLVTKLAVTWEDHHGWA